MTRAAVEHLVDALAWYYDRIYDGPECVRPDWVHDAEEMLADVRVGPDADAQTRSETVEAIIAEARGG